ncbi:hypothetical protein HYU23_04390 [Candidatus Woesearchaeota archaeon]|nr:hypothetical protein [Candidatus Woesearchaeota archaeon]
MKNIFSWYNVGALILFIGLLWMFLPHAFHERLISQIEETSHIIHIFQGVIISIVGIFVMVLSNKKN